MLSPEPWKVGGCRPLPNSSSSSQPFRRSCPTEALSTPLWLAKLLGAIINPDKSLKREGEMGEQAQFAVGPLENQSG